MKKYIISFLSLCLMLLCSFMPYSSYLLDKNKEPYEAPSSYTPSDKVYPSVGKYGDIAWYEGNIYALRSDGVLVNIGTEEETTLINEDDYFFKIVSGDGLFLSDRGIYVADAQGMKIYHFSWDGILLNEFSQPESSLYDSSIPFMPQSVISDYAGNVYALVPDLFEGAVMFSENGDLLGFFGANPVEMTFSMKLDQMWKKILSKEQKGAMERFVPTAYSGFDIDDEGFVYTCSETITDDSRKIRKLNPSGKGLWDSKNLSFGDSIDWDELVDGVSAESKFTDIFEDDGIISIIDKSRGRIFRYTGEGRLLSVFGGIGNQMGLFQNPISIDGSAETIYVLDAADSSITSFKLTEFGSDLLSLARLYDEGKYSEAKYYAERVLRLDDKNTLASLALGKALYAEEKSGEALKALEASGDREEYSKVKSSMRLDWFRANLSYLLFAVLVVVVLLYLKKRYLPSFGLNMPWLKRNMVAIIHPFDEMYEKKRRNDFSPVFSYGVVLLWFIVSVLRYFAAGYAFNHNNPKDFILFTPIVSTIGAYVLWCTISWATGIFLDGIGKPRELFLGYAYALVPYVLASFVSLVLSWVLSMDEKAFISVVEYIGLVWSVFLLISYTSTLNQYSFSKTMLNILMTAIGSLIVVFLFITVVVLFEHTSSLFSLAFAELRLRR